MHLLFIDEDNKRKPLRNEANSPFKTSSGNKITAHFGYIESIQTSVKLVIRCKIAPNFDGVPGSYNLPVYENS